MNSPAFQQQQRQFLKHLRSPATTNPPAGFEPARLAVYADLLYNKFDESLSACFPVINRILGETSWRALVLEFIARHPCRTPYYRRIPDEFMHYLRHDRPVDSALPFLGDLAHFEWVELQLAVTEGHPIAWQAVDDQQLLDEVPVYASVMQLLHYQWPVEEIGPDYLPTQEPEDISYILGFRNDMDQVQFIALTTATAELVRLTHAGLSGRQALQSMASQLNTTAFERFLQFGQQTLTELNQHGAIVGSRAATTTKDYL